MGGRTGLDFVHGSIRICLGRGSEVGLDFVGALADVLALVLCVGGAVALVALKAKGRLGPGALLLGPLHCDGHGAVISDLIHRKLIMKRGW